MHFLQMPPEILEQIFKDAFNLINLSRTCCRFNELISSSPVLMNKIVLKLDKFIENSFEREDYLQFLDSRKALLASSRPFRHVLIENDYHSKYIKILKKNSASISSLTISSEDDDNFLDGDDLIKVLKVLSNSLTSIELNAVGSLSFHKPDVILMPKLKSLKLFNWSFEILQLFMNSRITDLRIEMTDGNFNRWNIKFLVDFLSVQVDLKIFRAYSDLLMNGILTNDHGNDSDDDSDYEHDENEMLTDADVVDKFKFNLEELSYLQELYEYSDVTKVNQFLRKQTNLKKFQGGLQSESVAVLLELPNLKYVNLYTDQNELRISHLNRNIIELSTNRVDLLRFTPNVKILKLPFLQVTKLSKILTAQSHPQLEKLEITLGNYCDLTEISLKIQSIKNVVFYKLYSRLSNKELLLFISANDQIEKLVLTCFIKPEELITILKTLKNLQCLDLANAISDDVNTLATVINEFGSKLQYLKIPNRMDLIEDSKNIQSPSLKIYY